MRKEEDTLGEKELPDDVYYGVQTKRAVENFPVSGFTEDRVLIRSYVVIKKACAVVNERLGKLDEEKNKFILKACEDILSGSYQDQFPVDVFQAGAGTSFNMNVNEVIANRALELMGEEKGDYEKLHPNDHVNMSQSSNDTFPTASHIAMIKKGDELISVLKELAGSFKEKGEEFLNVPKSGRTHLIDATPVTLGDELLAYSSTILRCAEDIEESKRNLLELPIGGTATGTGVNTPEGFREEVIEELSEELGHRFKPAENSFELIHSRKLMVDLSGALKSLAVELDRISDDLRLMASGPRTGLNEIDLPKLQPGSSIMPGKVNPVMVECLNMICFEIIGNDTTVTHAAQAGQLDMNVMTPVMTYNIINTMNLLINYLPAFNEKCIQGIEANEEVCEEYLFKSASLATILTPKIGYERAADLALESLKKGVTIPELAVDKGILTEEEVGELFDPDKMATNKYR